MSGQRAQQPELFPQRERSEPLAQRLLDWQPRLWPVASDWQPLLTRFLESETASHLGDFMRARLAADATIYPPKPLRALELTSLASVRVVIVGQDPYHGPGQAEGLAFSVAPGNKLPPSLRNIFKEVARDAAAHRPGATPWSWPSSGSLVTWAQQGVLLLNTCLTVEQGSPASHANHGWEALTDELVAAVIQTASPVVFMLWGSHAQALIRRQPALGDCDGASATSARRLVLTANHPSPLSALRPPQPFIGCGHFASANEFLRQQGCEPIRW